MLASATPAARHGAGGGRLTGHRAGLSIGLGLSIIASAASLVTDDDAVCPSVAGTWDSQLVPHSLLALGAGLRSRDQSALAEAKRGPLTALLAGRTRKQLQAPTAAPQEAVVLSPAQEVSGEATETRAQAARSCELSAWSDWSSCDAKDNGATSAASLWRSRSRVVITPPCPPGNLTEMAGCEDNSSLVSSGDLEPNATQPTTLPAENITLQPLSEADLKKANETPNNMTGDCEYSDWADWSHCSAHGDAVLLSEGIRSRARSVITPPCPADNLTEDAACELSEWVAASAGDDRGYSDGYDGHIGAYYSRAASVSRQCHTFAVAVAVALCMP